MNFRLALVAFMLLTSVESGDAQDQGARASSPKCSRGTLYVNLRGDGDGCFGGPQGTPNNVTLLQRPNFFTGHAAQSGQTYKTRPPWNVAGVDYPVGIPSGTILKDPATGKLPIGCSYNPAGMSAPFRGPLVNCQAVKIIKLDGWDFSGNLTGASHGCVDLVFDASVSFIIIRNSYFKPDASCLGKSNNGLPIQIFQVDPGHASWEVENNIFDSSPPRAGPGSAFIPISLSAGAASTFKYNAFVNIPFDPVNGTAAASNWLFAYNYVENFVFDVSNQNHGEVANLTGNGSPKFTIYEFNTILRSRGDGIGSGTAAFRISNQIGGSHIFLDAEVLNNVVVHNLNSGQLITNVALADLNNTQAATKIADNFIDKTGARYYAEAENVKSCTTPVFWSKNYDLVSGNIVDIGTTATIGGLFISGTTPKSGNGACK